MAKPSPSNHELELIRVIRNRIDDLNLKEDYLTDKNLIRFLRARNENLNQTEAMIRKNVTWVEEMEISTILEYIPPQNFENHFPWSVVGFDDLGGPLVVLPIGSWNPSRVAGMREDYISLSLKYFEIAMNVMKEASKGRDYIPQFTMIMDLQGLSWRHYTSYDALQGTLTMIRYFEANYPETIRVGALVNAPSIFGMFWTFIRPLMSAATHKKLLFLGYDKALWRETLLQYAKEDQIPRQYGGTRTNSYELSLKEFGIGGSGKCIYHHAGKDGHRR